MDKPDANKIPDIGLEKVRDKNAALLMRSQKKKNKENFSESKLPTFLGLLLLIVEVVVGLLFIQNKNLESLALKNIVNPKDVRISNITENSFTVSWITDKKTTGIVKIGKSEKDISDTYKQVQKEDTYVHTVNITDLSPEQTYYFTLNSANFSFKNSSGSGTWNAKTASANLAPPATEIIAGKVIKEDNLPVANASVFINVNGSPFISTLTDNEGLWVLNLGTALNQSLTDYMVLTKNKTPIEIFVQSGIYGISAGRTTLSEINVLEPMKLGQIYILNPAETDSYIENAPEAELTI